MATRLIFHTIDSMRGGVSPFDDVITGMVAGNELRIACPYLGLSYLRRVIEQCSGWRLLTDVQEWLISHTPESRSNIVDFILSNSDRVRHCKDLHAKLIIAGARALAGSANFTEKGITGRVELSVFFENCEQVDELRTWFDLLWGHTSPVAEPDLRSCMASMPPAARTFVIPQLPCSFPGVASKLRQGSLTGGSTNAEERLIARLRLAPDRRWAESWLDLAKELVEFGDFGPDDGRLVMSLPKGKFLPVSVNRRYVLTAFRLDEGQHEKRWLIPGYAAPPDQAVVELILPASMRRRIDNLPATIRHSSFDPGFAGETADNVPQFVSFSMTSIFTFAPDVLAGWQEAVLVEREHQRVSNFRKFHEPAVYRAATDLDYRRQLLDSAFTDADI